MLTFDVNTAALVIGGLPQEPVEKAELTIRLALRGERIGVLADPQLIHYTDEPTHRTYGVFIQPPETFAGVAKRVVAALRVKHPDRNDGSFFVAATRFGVEGVETDAHDEATDGE